MRKSAGKAAITPVLTVQLSLVVIGTSEKLRKVAGRLVQPQLIMQLTQIAVPGT